MEGTFAEKKEMKRTESNEMKRNKASKQTDKQTIDDLVWPTAL